MRAIGRLATDYLPNPDQIAALIDKRKFPHAPGLVADSIEPGDAVRRKLRGTHGGVDRIDIANPDIAARIAGRRIKIRVCEEMQLHLATRQDRVARIVRVRVADKAQPPIEGDRVFDRATGEQWNRTVWGFGSGSHRFLIVG